MAKWWNSKWRYRKRITIQSSKVADNHSNFPILISETDASLKRHVSQPNAGDVVFVDSDGSTQLDYEIEKWDSSDGTLVAHVRIPTMDKDNDKTIYVYYGNIGCADQQNVTGVWDDNTLMVQHLQETDIDGGAGDIKDSTSHGNDGTTYGIDESDQVSGKVDGGFNFNNIESSAERVDIPDTFFQSDINSATLEYWVYITEQHVNYSCHIHRGDTGTIGMTVWWAGRSLGGYLTVTFGATNGGWALGQTDIKLETGTWYHIAGTWDGTQGKVFLNGNKVKTYGQTTINNKPCIFTIGRNRIGATYEYLFNGMIDNFRFSNTARSEEWMLTSFNTQNDPSSFYTVGSQEFQRGGPRRRVRRIKEYLLNIIAPVYKENYIELKVYSLLEIEKSVEFYLTSNVSKEIEEEFKVLAKLDHSKLSRILEAL